MRTVDRSCSEPAIASTAAGLADQTRISRRILAPPVLGSQIAPRYQLDVWTYGTEISEKGPGMRNWIPTGGRLAIVMVAFATIVASCTGDAATTTTTSPGDDAPTTTQGTEETTPTTEGEPEPPTTASTLRMSISQDESTLTPFTHVSSPPFLDLVWDLSLIHI